MRPLKPVVTLVLTLAAFGVGYDWTPASAIEPATVDSAPSSQAAFEVVGDNGSMIVSVEDLEKIGLYRITTDSPWEAGRLVFEGVLFRDFLQKVGLADADEILVKATDNYVQTIPREDWIDGPLLLATRQDGQPLTRRSQGPTRLIYPLLDRPEYDTELHKPRWVWMITSIERAQ